MSLLNFDFQAQRGIQGLRNAGGGAIDLNLVPYDLLTDREKKKNRERCQELLKYIQYQVLGSLIRSNVSYNSSLTGMLHTYIQ